MLEALTTVTEKNEKMPFENNVTRQKYKKKITGSTKQDKNNREHTNRQEKIRHRGRYYIKISE